MIKRYAIYRVGFRYTKEGKALSQTVDILDYKRACKVLSDCALSWKAGDCFLSGFNVWMETVQEEKRYHSEQYEV